MGQQVTTASFARRVEYDNEIITHTLASGSTYLGQVMRRDIATWWDTKTGVATGHFVEVYLHMVCYYVNTHPDLSHEPKVAMVCHDFYTAIAGSGKTDSPANPRTADTSLGPQTLRAANISTEAFRTLRYLFIPIHRDGHSSLLAVSPIHRKIEILDSNTRKPGVYDRILTIASGFLAAELGAAFEPGEWDVLIELCPRQPTVDNPGECGAHTCQYAMQLACNAELHPTSFGDGYVELGEDRSARRRRLVREVLHGSFTGPYRHAVYPSNDCRGDNRLYKSGLWQPLKV